MRGNRVSGLCPVGVAVRDKEGKQKFQADFLTCVRENCIFAEKIFQTSTSSGNTLTQTHADTLTGRAPV